MNLTLLPIYNTFTEETSKTSHSISSVESSELESMREDLLKASKTLTRACEMKLEHLSSLDIKELKDIAKVILDLQSTYFSKPEVVVNNYQQNISNTQLNFFKSIMKDEI